MVTREEAGTRTLFDEKGISYNFSKRKGVWNYLKSESMTSLALNWENEEEMNRELSKLCKELGYIVIDEHIYNEIIYDNGRQGTYQGNNGVDLTLMIDDKMVMFELKNDSSCFKGAQGLGQLMCYMEKDEDYIEWRKWMGWTELKHSKLIGILVLTDGRNIEYLLRIIKKIDYSIKLLVFNPVILKIKIAKDNFIESLKEAIE